MMMKYQWMCGVLVTLIILSSCKNNTKSNQQETVKKDSVTSNVRGINEVAKANSSSEILQIKQVPVLCYHHIKDRVRPNEVYAVTKVEFADHMKMLKDSGYQTILPQQYYDYLLFGKALPAKPVMVSFDDTRQEHFSIAGNEMEKYGFKGVFFIMNIAIGKPGYMSAEEIKALSDSGHIIGSHTWDHQNAKKLKGEEWTRQLDEPKAKLESITGKRVDFFAYPFGEWNDSAVYQVKNRGIKAAFQLTQKRSESEPLYTIRRMIVPSGWSGAKLKKFMDKQF